MRRHDRGGDLRSTLTRRDLALAGLALVAGLRPLRAFASPPEWRSYDLVTRVEVSDPGGPATAWIPLPSFATDWQTSAEPTWTGNATVRITTDARTGARILVAEWPAGTSAPVVEVTVRASTRDRAVDLAAKATVPPESSAVLERALKPSRLIRTDGIVKTTASAAVGARTGDVEKARAVYDWIVDHTFRDAKVKGCGRGDIATMLETGNLGGKCADLNGLFVGMARAVGVPARELYGIRVAPSSEFSSLGKTGDVTKGQHCRAEFYAAGHGWVPVDPADVRKVVLEQDGGVPLDSDIARKARAKLFGAVEMNWVAFNSGADLALPGAQAGEVAYFMYPQVEVGGVRRDPLDPDTVKYTITSRPA